MAFDFLYNTNSIGELLTVQARRQPNKNLIWSDEKCWTYADVEAQATALASGLIGLGLQKGDRLAVILPNSPAYIITLFAAAKAGVILNPINVRRHRAEVLSRLTRTRPIALLTNTEHLKLITELSNDIPEMKHLISVDGGAGAVAWNDLVASTAVAAAPTISPHDVAVILYTLGNSGEPRGAMLSHQSLIRNAIGVASTLNAGPEDVFLGAVPFSNAFGLTPTIFACIVAGASLAPLPTYHADKALALIEKAKITVHHGVPTMFALELNHPKFKSEACASLRVGIMSGAACPAELVTRVREQMHCNLILAYGLTEASPSVTMTHLQDDLITATQTVGRAMEGVSLKVIDIDGNTLGEGQEGELCIKGYNVMKGYWNDPQATAQVLGDDGWLRTGDVATIDPDGLVKIVGRKGDVINRGGYKIYPGTVEMVLRSYSGVKEAAVIGVPDSIYGELPCACVVRSADAKFSAAQLILYASERLTDYAVPDHVMFLDALPRSASGVIRKDMLREWVRSRGHA